MRMRNLKIEDEKVRGLEVENKSSDSQPLNFLTSYLLVLLITLTLTACDKVPKTLTDPTTTVSFSGSNPGSNSIYMAQNSSLSNGDVLAIDVKANNISSNVYGAAFDVDFDLLKMTYQGYAAGSLLESGGNTVSYEIAANNGKLVIGVSRQGSVGGVTGSGTIVTLKFDVTGGSAVSFSNNELRDSSNQAISSITWYGGTVTAQ